LLENLSEEIKYVVESKKRVEKSNQERIKKFNLKYFKEEWMNVVNQFNEQTS